MPRRWDAGVLRLMARLGCFPTRSPPASSASLGVKAAELAKNYTEMGAAMRSGEMASHFKKHRPTRFHKTKLEDYAPTFAAIYAQP